VANPKEGAPSSDAIGYGITSSGAVRTGLAARGWEVTRPALTPTPSSGFPRIDRLRWIVHSYSRILDEFTRQPPDVVFCFHAFHTFPVEVRRMLLDLGLRVPIVGYTHGSHWDVTDTYRSDHYPGLALADLANLDVLDRVLVVSSWMRDALGAGIARLNAALAQAILRKVRVVGLPLDMATIDRHRPDSPFLRTTVVFNHAPVRSKNPELFVAVMDDIMSRHPVDVLFTRRFRPEDPGGPDVARLAQRYPGRVILGNDLPIPEYYRALWSAQLQVSTASHESLGMATLEAMYTATCCVLPRVANYPALCGNHPEVLYEPGPDGLRDRLIHLIQREDVRTRTGHELARQAARYEVDVVVDAIAEVLHEVVG
jgi:Glycosyltransferase Family 4